MPYARGADLVESLLTEWITTRGANGNELSGAGRTLTSASYNLPATIAQGAATLSFAYDSDHVRFQQTAPEGTTLYVRDPWGASGAWAEQVTSAGTGLVQWNDYLMAVGEMVGLHVKRSDGSNYTRYYHKDHLGSVVSLPDDAGALAASAARHKPRRAYRSSKSPLVRSARFIRGRTSII